MPFLPGTVFTAGFGLEGGGSNFKELLLPAVEHSGLDLEFVAHLRNGLLLQMAPQEWRPSLRGCSALWASSRVLSVILTAEHHLPFPAEAEHPRLSEMTSLRTPDVVLGTGAHVRCM